MYFVDKNVFWSILFIIFIFWIYPNWSFIMKSFTFTLWIMAVCVLSLSSCSKESLEDRASAEFTSEVLPVDYSDLELEVLDLVNDYRAANDLPQLEFLDEISKQAQNHNLHMIETNEVCHDDFADRYSLLVQSVRAKAVSENVAFGYRTADAVVAAWVKSEGHKKNLDGEFTHFGISVKEDAEGKFYYTNIFVQK